MLQISRLSTVALVPLTISTISTAERRLLTAQQQLSFVLSPQSISLYILRIRASRERAIAYSQTPSAQHNTSITHEMAPLTGAQVAKHDNKDSCWVIVHGKAYDVTEFLPEQSATPSSSPR